MPKDETKDKKPKATELRIVFETSILYTGSASDFVRQEASNIITEHSKHPDLKISWYLPDTVRHERQFQMQKRAMELLPSIQKLERLLGHRLNITESILEQRVKEAVEKQLQDLGLSIIELDTTKVDWSRLIHDAYYRKAPFANGENERGFRDALIAEAFIQLVEDSPKTPRACRIVFVTGDSYLADAVKQRIKDATNVRILDSLEALRGFINTLVEEVTEEFVETWRTSAKILFFEKDKEECLYYKEKLRDRISEKFSDILKKVPQGADHRRNGTWYIGSPQFVKKQQQRVLWATRIEVEAEAYKYSTISTGFWESGATPSTGIWTTGTIPDNVAWSPGTLADNIVWSPRYIPYDSASDLGSVSQSPGNFTWQPRAMSSEKLVSKGKSIFEVLWSVQITTSGNFRAPKIESVNHVETIWE